MRGSANGFKSEPKRVGGIDGGGIERQEVEVKEVDLRKRRSEAREEV